MLANFKRKFFVVSLLAFVRAFFITMLIKMSSHLWGYEDSNGPKTWFQMFPEAAGQKQSPIDIKTSDDLRVPPPSTKLQWKYDTNIIEKLVNTGHCWKVNVNGETSELTGGPLEGVYQLKQFHCHWGKNNDEGSEHTIDGKAFAGELHFVHWNITKYETFEEAANHADGLCVLGILLKSGDYNEELSKISSLLGEIIYRNQSITIDEPVDISKLIPQKSGYYTYYGSLTTPPCSECVIWIVFQEPIEVSEKQLETFRSLKFVCEDEECEKGGYMHENFRPTNPVGERTVVKYSE